MSDAARYFTKYSIPVIADIFDVVTKRLSEVTWVSSSDVWKYCAEESIILENIDVSGFPKVKIIHTLTSAFCPAADQIVADINSAAISVEGVDECSVETTFDPPFGPEMMTEEVKLALGIF